MSGVRERLAQLESLARQVLPQPSSGRVVIVTFNIGEKPVTTPHVPKVVIPLPWARHSVGGKRQ